MSNESWNFETRQIHAGQTADPATGARALPIYQTTSFVFDSAQQAADRFALKELGPIYTRIGNPTQEVVENRIADLEGGVGALLVSSGQAAETLAILNIAEAGDHIVASPSLYGGTYNLLHYTLPKLGIQTTFVTDPHDAQAWKDAVQPNTKLFFAETIPNPKADILDIELVAGRRARVRRPADRRQHGRDAVPDQPAEVGRRHRRALGDEVPGRSRLRDRRRHRRRRLVRLRAAPGAVPQLQHPRPVVQRARVRAGPRRRRPVRRQPVLHPQGARAAAARPRLGDLPVQRVPHRAGHRDAVAADRAARRERRRRSPPGWRRARTSAPCTTPAWSRARGTPRS